MFSISFWKPIFNNSSASSRVKVLILSKEIFPLFNKSLILPGVATITCGLSFNSLNCLSYPLPPKIKQTFALENFPILLIPLCIWEANSLVGAITKCSIPIESSVIMFEIGIPNAPVFPVPVWAWPITSFPSNAALNVSVWIGVGSLKPISSRLFCTFSFISFISLNVMFFLFSFLLFFSSRKLNQLFKCISIKFINLN